VYTTNDTLPGSTSSWLPCVDGLWERCAWQIEITVPKKVRDIFPKTVVRSSHRTRSSFAVHNGDSHVNVSEPARQSNFSQEELDLEMVIVCTGDFLKEVFPFLSLDSNGLVNFKELIDKNGNIYRSAVGFGPSDCVCSRTIFKNESFGSTRI
jgi:hypothetical protein